MGIYLVLSPLENWGIGDFSILRFFDFSIGFTIYDLRFTIGLRHWRIWAMGEWRFFDSSIFRLKCWIGAFRKLDLRFTIYDWIEALADLGVGGWRVDCSTLDFIAETQRLCRCFLQSSLLLPLLSSCLSPFPLFTFSPSPSAGGEIMV